MKNNKRKIKNNQLEYKLFCLLFSKAPLPIGKKREGK